MDFDFDSLVDGCMKAITSKIGNLNTLNVVVVGKTGVGKSTLVNAIFRENLATTGTGRPVTQRMCKYTKQDVPLAIYDTKGFELGNEAQQEVKEELLKTIKEGHKTEDIAKMIHCIWYCVSVTSSRFEPEEIQWIKDFTTKNQYQVPIIIVLTQAFFKKKAQEMKNQIEAENLDVVQVVPVLAQDCNEFDDGHIVKAYGTDTLIEIMQRVLPDGLGDTLMHVQQVNLELKKKKAQAAVGAAVTSAIGATLSPIPFSDAALLIPIEITMLASITVVFGFDANKTLLTTLVSSVVGPGSMTVAGKALVANVLKMIPGGGTLVGVAISGGTAILLTTALGEAYIGIMTAMYNGELDEKDLKTPSGKKKFQKLFKKQLKKSGTKEKDGWFRKITALWHKEQLGEPIQK